jgi:hypothetical protein
MHAIEAKQSRRRSEPEISVFCLHDGPYGSGNSIFRDVDRPQETRYFVKGGDTLRRAEAKWAPAGDALSDSPSIER